MKTLLWTLSIGSLAGGIAAVALLASLLRSMPGGPFIGGAGVMLALLAGAVLVVLVATGLGTGYALRRHGHAGPLHVHLVFAGALLVSAAGFVDSTVSAPSPLMVPAAKSAVPSPLKSPLATS